MPHLVLADASTVVIVVVLAFVVVSLGVTIAFLFLARHWLRALVSGDPVPLTSIVGMLLRKMPIGRVLQAHVRLRQAGIDVPTEALESHVLAGGDVERVAEWMVAAKASGLDVSWGQLAKLDLARKLPDVADVAGAGLSQLTSALDGSEE
jgi:uncharacterized protein YqfA (UPF0365 family)